MATDIAFASGVMALAGSQAPIALKIFLTALAIVDDIGAVLVIAFFYTAKINWPSLALAGLVVLVLLLANFLRIQNLIFYLGFGVVLWLKVKSIIGHIKPVRGKSHPAPVFCLSLRMQLCGLLPGDIHHPIDTKFVGDHTK